MSEKVVVVVKGLIIFERRALIVKRSTSDQVGGGTWECPGGKIEFGEGLETALIREIFEEVGISVKVGKILYATTFNTNPVRQVVVLTYLCKSDSREVTLSEEHTDFLWATKEQLKTYLPSDILLDFEKNHVFDLL